MPTTYKGATVPLSSDLADGPAAFRAFTDSLPATDALDTAQVPIGSVVVTIRTTAPTNWLLLDGSTVAGAQTLYPKLWAIVPPSWQSGVNLILPDARGRIIVGLDPANTGIDAIGEKAGSQSVTLAQANLPPHPHNLSLSTGGRSATHTHGAGVAGANRFFVDQTIGGFGLSGSGGVIATSQTAAETTDHTHLVAGPTDNGPGTSAPITLPLPPVIAFNYLLRAA